MDVPQVIAGRFRIECKIGTGGMGTVYRAKQLGLERPVAVKIIRPEFAADRDVAERFMREARTMARLRHRHAAMIFDAGTLTDGRHFIIMEYVDGLTLSQVMVRQGPLPAEQAVRIAIEICDVLEEAHQLGIIHRDLKPSNIMLNERGACVLDFGVAKVLANSTESTATHASTGSGQIVGTPRYMSPEQCLGQPVGARSDLYSLGVLLYEMLAGRPPFIDSLPSAMMVKQATAPPPPLPQLRKGIPRSLALAVHTLLAKRPNDRPRTAAEARRVLERSLSRPESILPEVEPLAATVATAAGRNSALFRLAAPLAMVAALGALLLVWGSSGKTVQNASAESEIAAPEVSHNQEENSLAKETVRPASPKPVNARSKLSPAQARNIVGALGHGMIGDVRVLQTERGSALVAIHEERQRGTTHFFLLEKQGRSFRVVARGPLDSADFRHADWSADTVDADGDGFHEIVFTGRNAKGKPNISRLLLYVPSSRETYSLSVESGGASGKPRFAVWSPNAASIESAPYRVALRERIKRTVARKRNR
ncbi:MAG TPA: serine/threonine-protein kinase [Pyrinomonadaceae bacterium]|nr:serine/threonine-protein kinase [Pyrinomonadaceae bacterium]